jgi:hypothetical protein
MNQQGGDQIGCRLEEIALKDLRVCSARYGRGIPSIMHRRKVSLNARSILSEHESKWTVVADSNLHNKNTFNAEEIFPELDEIEEKSSAPTSHPVNFGAVSPRVNNIKRVPN